ncbi:hypothetical protein [Metabacillus malikii]|nr:hypothetical protein [Metabacillus malikii]
MYQLGVFPVYFPEDKTEYIPALITMVIFGIAAFLVFRFIVKISKQEQGKVDKQYEQMKQPNNDQE